MSNLTLKEQLAALAPVSSPVEMRHPPQRKPLKASSTKQKPAWLEQAQYGVELLKAHFPASFKEVQDIQPLKIGIKQDLVIRLGSKENIVLHDKACMVNSLSYYVSSDSYLKKVIAGSERIDLDGHSVGIVTPEEAQYSTNCRQAKLQKRTMKSAATAT